MSKRLLLNLYWRLPIRLDVKFLSNFRVGIFTFTFVYLHFKVLNAFLAVQSLGLLLNCD